MEVINVEGLVKQYRDHRAINGIDFSVQENEIIGIIGKNGAGKSTLLKILAGYYRSTRGHVRVLGEDPFDSLYVSENLVFVDDQMVFSAELTLKDILEMAEKFFPNWNTGLANRLFEYFSFHPKQIHNQLSKGKKSTFNMIFGLAAQTPITILDEPTTGMDYSVRKDFYRALLKSYIDKPRTILVSSHLLNELEGVLESILLIDNGEVVIQESIEVLKDNTVGLTGESLILKELVNQRTVIYEEELDNGETYQVIYGSLSEETRLSLERQGVRIGAVKMDDLCVYLTHAKQGGIDRVFK